MFLQPVSTGNLSKQPLKDKHCTVRRLKLKQPVVQPLESPSSLDCNHTLTWLNVVLQTMCDLCVTSQLIRVPFSNVLLID